jgi:hypothetical protein
LSASHLQTAPAFCSIIPHLFGKSNTGLAGNWLAARI